VWVKFYSWKSTGCFRNDFQGLFSYVPQRSWHNCIACLLVVISFFCHSWNEFCEVLTAQYVDCSKQGIRYNCLSTKWTWCSLKCCPFHPSLCFLMKKHKKWSLRALFFIWSPPNARSGSTIGRLLINGSWPSYFTTVCSKISSWSVAPLALRCVLNWVTKVNWVTRWNNVTEKGPFSKEQEARTSNVK